LIASAISITMSGLSATLTSLVERSGHSHSSHGVPRRKLVRCLRRLGKGVSLRVKYRELAMEGTLMDRLLLMLVSLALVMFGLDPFAGALKPAELEKWKNWPRRNRRGARGSHV
jgi:hypothetical protein